MPIENALIPQTCRVVERWVEAEDVVTLSLVPEAGGQWPGLPGQFNMLYVFGVGEVPISVSHCSGADNPIWHTIRSVGPVSAALCRLQVGDVVGVRGPYGNSWPLDEVAKKDVLLIAGGLGLAPMRPVIEHVLSHRKSYGDVTLLYGCRTPEAMIFTEELKGWTQDEGLEVAVTVDHADQSWTGEVGAITSLLDTIEFNPEGTASMVCGPNLMMRFVVSALEGIGCPAGSIFLSMERNMKCAIGQCGRCQYGPHFVCHDGPIFRYDKVKSLFRLAGI